MRGQSTHNGASTSGQATDIDPYTGDRLNQHWWDRP